MWSTSLSLARRGSPVKIDVIGDGPLRASLTERVRSENLDNVSLHGFVDESRKWVVATLILDFLASDEPPATLPGAARSDRRCRSA